MPADELPAGVPEECGGEDGDKRQPDGRFAAGNTTGTKRKGTTRLAVRLSLGPIQADPAFAPYLRSARHFRRTQCAAIARDIGGGICGPAPSSIVASAALQLAASRYLFDRATAGDPALFTQASRLADASRQNLLAAHELAAREAQHRVERQGAPTPWFLESGPAGSEAARSTATEPTTDATDALQGNVGAARGGES